MARDVGQKRPQRRRRERHFIGSTSQIIESRSDGPRECARSGRIERGILVAAKCVAREPNKMIGDKTHAERRIDLAAF